MSIRRAARNGRPPDLHRRQIKAAVAELIDSMKSLPDA
jgi:hypothetical protein